MRLMDLLFQRSTRLMDLVSPPDRASRSVSGLEHLDLIT
jgi:hypothetical protein